MNRQRGSMAVEIVILAPVFVLLLVFVTYVARVSMAQHELLRAADTAARSASQARMASMSRRGAEVAGQTMKENGNHCINFRAQVHRRWVDGNIQVEVMAQCRVNVLGLSLLGIRSPVLKATSSEVVDIYRHP